MCFSNMKQMLPFSVFGFLHEKIKKKKQYLIALQNKTLSFLSERGANFP